MIYTDGVFNVQSKGNIDRRQMVKLPVTRKEPISIPQDRLFVTYWSTSGFMQSFQNNNHLMSLLPGLCHNTPVFLQQLSQPDHFHNSYLLLFLHIYTFFESPFLSMLIIGRIISFFHQKSQNKEDDAGQKDTLLRFQQQFQS
jgi:hypothetical protein